MPVERSMFLSDGYDGVRAKIAEVLDLVHPNGLLYKHIPMDTISEGEGNALLLVRKYHGKMLKHEKSGLKRIIYGWREEKGRKN